MKADIKLIILTVFFFLSSYFSIKIIPTFSENCIYSNSILYETKCRFLTSLFVFFLLSAITTFSLVMTYIIWWFYEKAGFTKTEKINKKEVDKNEIQSN